MVLTAKLKMITAVIIIPITINSITLFPLHSNHVDKTGTEGKKKKCNIYISNVLPPKYLIVFGIRLPLC